MIVDRYDASDPEVGAMLKRKLSMAVLVLVSFCGLARAEVVFVDARATGLSDGSRWADAYPTLSAVIESAVPGSEIWVAAGSYSGPISLKNGVSVIGGFAGNEMGRAASNPEANVTYVTGNGQTRAVESSGNDATAVLRGFHVTGGLVRMPGPGERVKYGAGMALEGSSASIVHCVFSGNRAETLGGALFNRGGSPTFVNCRFAANDGGMGAGAVFYRGDGSPTFINCVFATNTAWEAGAVVNLLGAPSFINCTFARNTASRGKGGAVVDHPGGAALRNCIVWNNSAVLGGSEAIYNHPGAGRLTAVANSAMQGGWAGEGNISDDPLFVNPAGGNFRLRAASPCRDRGRNQFLPAEFMDLNWDGVMSSAIPNDHARNPRVSGAAVDMGAFERAP